MALILHGEGLCCFKNVHNHHRHNCHSHSPKHDQTYHNNNKAKFEYRPLINEATDKRGNKKVWNPLSSPNHNHSRSNSLTRPYVYANGHSSGGSDMFRRNSHTVTALSEVTTNKIKEIIDLQSNDSFDVELNDDKLPISSELNDGRGCVSNGSAICPIHHYVHRDSSEHTPITSSDSEDLHEHHQHRHSLINHLHSSHSHDFSSKNINIQAAVIHVIGDFVQSIGVFISAIIIKIYVSCSFSYKKF